MLQNEVEKSKEKKEQYIIVMNSANHQAVKVGDKLFDTKEEAEEEMKKYENYKANGLYVTRL